ncbi:MAG: formyltransferase [Betaproteobacteria bacterium]|nr:MAG: formyltransferase [Betaproteobacteria bacterium]TMH55133.1 MAG: formyltransferase [Betaproteobacteria bacterium]
MTRAVVFAYHDVGCRCLRVLLDERIEVPLVVTHRDRPDERIWFASVAGLARARAIETLVPDDPNAPQIVERIRDLRPDFLFSFYYRLMLGAALLAIPRRGAFNMHGSLLPKYRGRVPVNWAIIHGETETGATLHEMVEKPDAGRIVDQEAVAILPDEPAVDVFGKVTAAAERVLRRSLPKLVDGSAVLRAQDLSQGGYYGGRRPEDGRIDWRAPAKRVHDLVRALAPPYPGAFTEVEGTRLRVLRTRRGAQKSGAGARAFLYAEGGRCYAACADGEILELLDVELDGRPLSAQEFANRIGDRRVRLH